MQFFCLFMVLGVSSVTFNFFAVRAMQTHILLPQMLEILALVGNFEWKTLSKGRKI